MKSFIVFFLFSFITLMAQITELQLTNTPNEVAVEAYNSVNPLNGDIAISYKIHNTNTGAIDVELVVVRNNQILYSHRFLHMTDPVVEYDGDGNIILCLLSRLHSNMDVIITKSTDYGQTFSAPITAIDVSDGWEADKQMLFIDKNLNSPYYNNIYIAATHIEPGEVGSITEIVFVRSIDGGNSFSSFLKISQQSPLGYFVSGTSLATDDDGSVYLFWYRETPISEQDVTPSKIFHLYFSKSTDGGESFASEVKILDDFIRPGIAVNQYYYTKHFYDQVGFRNSPFPYAVFDSFDGSIYIAMNAWGEYVPFEGNTDGTENANNFVIVRSTNGGDTWSQRDHSFPCDVFMPFLSADGNGNLYLTAYDSNVQNCDNYMSRMSILKSTNHGYSFTRFPFGATFEFVGAYIGTYIGDYYSHCYFSGNIYATYARNINNSLQMFLYSIPVEKDIFVQNLKTNETITTNLENSNLKINNSIIINSPGYVEDYEVFSNLTVEPEYDFYATFRFYNWPDFTGVRVKSITKFIDPLYIEFKSRFHKTKPLTVANYLEGGSAGLIKFGETGSGSITGDFKDRNSGFQENAFYYNEDGQIYLSYKSEAYNNLSNLYGINWNFFRWENGSGSTVRQEQVNSNTASEWKAKYKAINRSDNSSAYSNSGQRHLGRRSYNGDIYNVYESMGYIWLEKSTDNGSTWTLANDAAPVSSGIAKSPSLDFCTGHLLIVYQEKTSSGYLRIKLKLYDMSEDEVIDSAVVMENNNVDFSFDTQPVIADYYSTGRFMVIYRNNMDHDPFYDTGLHYDYGVVAYNYQTYNYYLSGLNSGNDYYINGTDEESLNPAVSTTPTGVQDNIHLIWQQGLESETYSHILYQKIQWNGSGFTFPAQINVSNGCGYTKNYKPSITSITSDDIPRVSWIGYISDEESEMQKSGSTSGTQSATIYRETVFRALDNPSSWSYGSNVVHANINRLESTPGYAITWAQESGSSYLNKCMRNTNFYSEYTLSTTGSAVELNNAGLFSNMFGYALHTASAPYYFGKSQYINTLQKEQINSMKAARSGVLYSGNAQFLFSFGDISVDNAQVFFPVIPDTMRIENFEELKQYLVSDPFMLENQSNFIYSVQYRAVDTASCAAVLGESGEVNFRLLLEDSNSGEVLGEYDNVTFTGNDLMKYENISYEVSTVGIGSRLVRLRLIPSATAELEPSLITRVRSADEQAKGSLKRIQYNGAEPVKDYSLTQNYPNPFNPVTEIEFALPEKSDITLKVYDILGTEIITLASGSYESGRYTVPFDGSSYASGVYIYKLSYGRGQTMTKKMTLLK